MNKQEIDRNGSKPIYKQIYSILYNEIEQEVYKQDEKLPSEKELCERFDVERNTVRKAMQMLADQGFVQKIPGFGTRLVPPKAVDVNEPIERQNILMVTQDNALNTTSVEYFHLKLYQMFEKRVWELGYNLIFKQLDNLFNFREIVRFTRPAAIIFDSHMKKQSYIQAQTFGIPCVSINHYTTYFTSIVSNNISGAYQIAKVLYDAGHRRIAVITGKKGYQTTNERLMGAQNLLYEKRIALKQQYVYSGNWLFDSGYEIGMRIASMKTSERPTAIFAFNDDMAYGCLSAMEKSGVSVPEEMSIAGFDKTDRYNGIFKRISTVDVNMKAIVEYACWFIDSAIQQKAPITCSKIQLETAFTGYETIATLDAKPDDQTMWRDE